MADEYESVDIGPHELRFYPPNQIRLYLRGAFDGPDVEAYFEATYKYADRCGGMVNSVTDLAKLERVTASGRDRLTQAGRRYPLYGSALIGASFATRTITNMIVYAGRALAPKTFTFPIRFVESLADAEAWFEELRRQRESK